MRSRLESMFARTNDHWVKALLLFFAASVIVFIQRIVMEFPNPDSVGNTIYKNDWQWECGLGRYGIRYLQELRGGG